MGTDMAAIDEEQVAELLGRFVNDLGATISAGNVLIGDKLGLYQTLAEAGPLTPSELAAYTATAERYVREWLPGQAAGGYISYDAETGRYSMTEAQALAFADPTGLVLPGAFQLAVACLSDESMILDAFRTGRGVAWGEHHPDVFTGCERFYRPGYVANLVSSWIPAVAGLRGDWPRASLSPMSAAGWERRPASWPEPIQPRPSPGSTHTWNRSSLPGRRPRRRTWPTGAISPWPGRRTSPAAVTGWWQRSTACTTWVTRSVPPATSGRPSPRTASG